MTQQSHTYLMLIALIVIMFFLDGCALNKHEKAQYNAWEESGQLVKEKSPEGALFLGLLFGAGSFYTQNPALGVISLVLWPVSIAWDGPVAVGQAYKINYEATETLYLTGGN